MLELIVLCLLYMLIMCRGTIVGKAHILLWRTIPAKIVAIDKKITGGRFHSASSKWANYLVNDKNWAVAVRRL